MSLFQAQAGVCQRQESAPGINWQELLKDLRANLTVFFQQPSHFHQSLAKAEATISERIQASQGEVAVWWASGGWSFICYFCLHCLVCERPWVHHFCSNSYASFFNEFSLDEARAWAFLTCLAVLLIAISHASSGNLSDLQKDLWCWAPCHCCRV